MARRDTLDGDVFQPLWAAGWQWQWLVVGAVFLGGYFVVEFGELLQGAAVILGGGAIAAVGVRYVDRRFEPLLDAGIDRVESAVLDAVDDAHADATVYTVLTADQRLAFVGPAKAYAVTTLLVGDDAFVVHDDASVSLAHRFFEVGADAHRYEYDTVSEIGYDAGELTVALTDGSENTYSLSREPVEALADVRARLSAVGT
ncbi:hypothetical protein C455_06711 [Haloferax larsenii JCM 13917]|nr:hypothetical protein [Haloferax larsenii]ELZ80542.1 hypothetical protein C455_06711 [Haloferax larsenii JCM 13917]